MNECSYICNIKQHKKQKTNRTMGLIFNTDIEKMNQVAYTLKAIANGTRLSIISLLASKEEMTVTQIGEKLPCEQSLLSHHLTDMRAKGILNCRREGKNCHYSLKNKELIQILDCLNACDCQE